MRILTFPNAGVCRADSSNDLSPVLTRKSAQYISTEKIYIVTFRDLFKHIFLANHSFSVSFCYWFGCAFPAHCNSAVLSLRSFGCLLKQVCSALSKQNCVVQLTRLK